MDISALSMLNDNLADACNPIVVDDEELVP